MSESSDFVSFPSLPSAGYSVLASDRDQLTVDLRDISSRVETFLIIAWGVVLASYTDSDHVVFGLLPSDQTTVRRCPLRLPQNEPALATVDQVKTILDGSSDEARASPGSFSNLLLIRNGTETAEVDSSLPLRIACLVQQDEIRLDALFDRRLVDPTLMQMMLFQLRHAFQCIQQNPEALLHTLRGCSPEGIQRMLQWNAASAPERREKLVHQLIEQRCQERPDAQAVCAWDGTLSYDQLNVKASRLATRLVKADIGPDRFVGLLMEKSMWTSVAMLAVMKAGGCFFLLDASQPTQRLGLMCRKAEARLILASATHTALAETLEVPTLVLPRDIPDTDGSLAELQTELVRPDNILYAGFTSGSTGEPKGVLIDHAAFSSGLREYSEQTELTADSRVLQFASHAFIVSVIDQLAPLAQGACLCVPSEKQLQNDLAGAIRDLKATQAKLTSSVLRLLSPSDTSGLATLIMPGEPIGAAQAAIWQQTGVSLISAYGLSESSKGVMFGSRNDADCELNRFSRPACAIPWVVDSEDPNILLPIGAEGELLLEGPCISRGYMNNNQQNSLTFLEDPAWLKEIRPDAHGRFLRTGDLARYNAEDGSLYVLGRKGTRVKIRGQRIELAEIEHHLAPQFETKEPAVVEVVVPSDDTPENPMLVAFVPVLGKRDRDANSGLFLPPDSEFRRKAQGALSNLRGVLPSFMVPSAVVATKYLPSTPSGKLHRRMLREEASKLSRKALLGYTSNDEAHQLPTSESESILQRVCAEVLQLSESTIGMQANFFDLGGNSITARQLVTQARQSGLNLTVADIFRQPSLSALVQCRRATTEGVLSADVAPDPFETTRNEFLSGVPAPWTADHIEDVFPTLEEQSAMASWHELDYHLFELTGPVDEARLFHACQALVDHHAILRSIFVPSGQTILQVVLCHIDVPFIVDAPTNQGDAVARAKSFCETDLQQPYRANEPLVQFRLVQDAPEHFVLIMRLLHAQYDAVCLPKLVSDLWAAYEDRDIHIASDFPVFVRECFRQRTTEAYAFWKGLLGSSQVAPAPFAEKPVAVEECVTFEREIPLPTPPKGITMATIIKAAWAKVLKEQTGQTDVVFGQFANIRNVALPKVDEIVGPCFNIIPVRAQLGTADYHHLLQTIQTQHAESISYESIGWKDLASTTCSNWTRDSTPGSVVMFQNFIRDQDRQIGPLRCRKLTQMFKIPPLKTVYLIVYPSSTSIALGLEASNAVLRKDEAEMVLDRLGRIIEELCSCRREAPLSREIVGEAPSSGKKRKREWKVELDDFFGEERDANGRKKRMGQSSIHHQRKTSQSAVAVVAT